MNLATQHRTSIRKHSFSPTPATEPYGLLLVLREPRHQLSLISIFMPTQDTEMKGSEILWNLETVARFTKV